jgi:MerR family mercuric resistance operon transcriptional regulator
MLLEARTMKPLTIGQVARQAGIGVETVRFYEREGLLQEPSRRASGYRQYPEDVVARLRFIRRAKELGFSLKEIKELLALRVDPTTTCREVKEQAEAKITDIDGKIASLLRMKRALVKLTATCRGQGPTSECPILDALDKEAEG